MLSLFTLYLWTRKSVILPVNYVEYSKMKFSNRNVTLGYWPYCYFLLLLTLFCSIAYSKEIQEHDYPAKCGYLGTFADCSHRGFVTIPDVPTWVVQLDVSSNKLRDNGTFDISHLVNLTELKVNRNGLHHVPTLTAAGSLRCLMLSRNRIQTFDAEALSGIPLLDELNLSYNEIEEITPGSFPYDNSLNKLYCNHNKIRKIHKSELEKLTKLIYLNLNKNQLYNLPRKFFSSQILLRTLELNKNNLKLINGLTFDGLEHLTTLQLRYNNIDFVSHGAFVGLKSINLLRLDHNRISVVSKGWMYGLESLTILSLSANQLRHIEADSWEPSHKLEEIDMSHNRLTSVDAHTFEHLNYLKVLKLDNNKISSIAEDAFGHTPSLETLLLNNNEISWTVEDMSGAFSKLHNLIKFNLASNHIKSINARAFDGLKKLISLDINNNNITSVQEHAFSSMVSLREFSMNSSSLLCDCNLQWLSDWIRSNSHSSSVTATCAYPSWLNKIHIAQLHSKNFTCNDSPKPKVIENPKSQLATKGETAHLKCSAVSSSPKPMSFLWRKNNINVTHPHVKENTSTTETGQMFARSELLIPNVTHSDAGKYQCVVSNSLGTTYSSKARLNIVILPRFIKVPVNVTVKASETVKLYCAATGEPIPEISWKKDGGNDFPSARERRMHVMPDDNVFFIINAKISDMGIYSCTAKNPAGTVVSNASLTVLEAPSITKHMENKEVTCGNTAVIECMVAGSPKPDLRWLKDGNSIIPTERHFFTAEGQLLIIVNTEKSDAGLYECEITNVLGTVRDATELRILPVVSILLNEEDVTGIIIITVVCCAVGTSIVWVVIIYQARKRMTTPVPNFNNDSLSMVPLPTERERSPDLFSDNLSERSSCKDSGTGSSAKRGSLDAGPDDPDRLDLSGVISHSTFSPVIETHKLLPSSFKPSVKVCVNSSTSPASYTFSSHSDQESSIRCTDETFRNS